jgi:hypothetical protein
MLVSIGSYSICDGTLTGGVAVSELRLRLDRLFDFVVPIGDVDSTLLDRVNSTLDASFTVKRTFSDVRAAEKFILQLDATLPVSGTVTFTTTGTGAFTRTIPDGFIVDHALLLENGATCFHQYHLIGGPPVS